MNGGGNDTARKKQDEDSSPGTEKKHPVLFYWLTGGAATVLAAVIAVSVTTSSSHSSTSTQNGSVPAAYQGSWAGIITYPTVQERSEVTLTLVAGQVGDEVGQWTNVNLDCGGTVTLESGGSTLSVHLITTSNVNGQCVPQANAQVSQAGSDIALVFDSDFGAAPGSGTLSPAS